MRGRSLQRARRQPAAPAGLCLLCEALRDEVHVFVAAAREIHDDDGIGRECRSELHCVCDRVRRFECRDDALGAGEQLERVERLGVGRGHVLGASELFEAGVLRADSGVIDAEAIECTADGSPFASCSTFVCMPCSIPGVPSVIVAA